jgi:hypothetical protein
MYYMMISLWLHMRKLKNPYFLSQSAKEEEEKKVEEKGYMSYHAATEEEKRN